MPYSPMELETVNQIILACVTRYIAIGALITIAMWAVSLLLFTKSPAAQVRDCALYFVVIGTLTLILALLPNRPLGSYTFWEPLIWFCFTMLLVFELFWVAYVVEGLWNAVKLINLSDHHPPPGNRQPPPASRWVGRTPGA
jgi:hypothetical protein